MSIRAKIEPLSLMSRRSKSEKEMNEQDSYRQLIVWLRSRHPQVFTEWERERKQRDAVTSSEKPLLSGPPSRFGSALDQLSPNASTSEVANAIQQELRSLGIGGGTPGVTPEGVPCVHLMKKGIYGRAYEESVTLARVRDVGYRRHLRQTFG